MRLFRLIFALSVLLATGLPAQAVSSSADAPHEMCIRDRPTIMNTNVYTNQVDDVCLKLLKTGAMLS